MKTKEAYKNRKSNSSIRIAPTCSATASLVLEGKTQADGMVEFNIPIKYTDCRGRSAAKIVITASASKGGDYFTGGSGSNMWLDDLELVY